MRHILVRSIVVGFGLILSLFGLQAQETAGGFPAKPVRVILTAAPTAVWVAERLK